MKDLKAIRGRYYIAELIEQGEHEHQDFKFAITDARKIARSLSAFANNDGGRLLIGVKDNGVIAGVRNEEDVYMVEHAAQSYCVPPQPIRVTAFACDGGLRVMRVEIDAASTRPVMVREAEGQLRAYFRVKDENIVASPLMVRGWREASQGGMRHVDANGMAVMNAVALGEAGVAQLARRTHLSLTLTEQTIVSLYAVGLVRILPTPEGDKIVANEQ